MGVIAGAGCFLIACYILYTWYNKTLPVRISSPKVSSQVEVLENKRPSKFIQRSGSPAISATAPSPETTTSLPKATLTAPNIEIDIITTESADSDSTIAQNTAMSSPSQVSPAPSFNMPPPQSKSPPRLKPPTFGMAPPRPGGSSLHPPPSAASSLRIPQTKVLSNASMAPSSLMAPPKPKSRQVALEPGHSPLDWAALTANPTANLRGKDAPEHLTRITPSQLKVQHGRKGKDVWTVYQGKVYNITPYVPFHPGGKGEILRGAGKDSAKLFDEAHPWVNWDGMLKECMVGILVGEEEMKQGNELDEMD